MDAAQGAPGAIWRPAGQSSYHFADGESKEGLEGEPGQMALQPDCASGGPSKRGALSPLSPYGHRKTQIVEGRLFLKRKVREDTWAAKSYYAN